MFFTNRQKKGRRLLLKHRLKILQQVQSLQLQAQSMQLDDISKKLKNKDTNVSRLITPETLKGINISSEDETRLLKLVNEYSQHAREINSTFFLYWETFFRSLVAAIGLSLILVGALDVIPISSVAGLIIFLGAFCMIFSPVIAGLLVYVFDDDDNYQDKLIFSLSDEEAPLEADIPEEYNYGLVHCSSK